MSFSITKADCSSLSSRYFKRWVNQVRDYSEIKEEDKEEGNKEEEIKDLEDNQLSLF